MTKTMTAVAAAAIVAVAAMAAPTEAEARRGWVAPAIIGGIAAGALFAGAAGAYGPYYGPAPAYGYYGAPAYYGPGPGCHIRRERVWDGYGWVVRRVRVCY